MAIPTFSQEQIARRYRKKMYLVYRYYKGFTQARITLGPDIKQVESRYTGWLVIPWYKWMNHVPQYLFDAYTSVSLYIKHLPKWKGVRKWID